MRRFTGQLLVCAVCGGFDLGVWFDLVFSGYCFDCWEAV